MERERKSGIELLKIISILLIVISHVSQTVGSGSPALGGLDSNIATTNPQYIILMLFRHFGALGNITFFICSAWFLCEGDKKRNGEKILRIVLDVWIISIVYLLVFIIAGEDLSIQDIIKSIFPTIFSNNWYITSYLMLYAIFPYLNWIIRKMSKKELLTVNIVAFLLYYGVGYVYNSAFFASKFILFIVMYFFVAYIKQYMGNIFMNKKWNLCLLFLGIGGYIGIALATNFLGLRISFLSTRVLHWSSMSSPFLLFVGIALFQIFRTKQFVNVGINRVAGLSLFVYLFHENILLRRYFRPRVFYYIYTNFGYQNIVLWVLGFAIILFIVAILISFFYQITVQKWSGRFAKKVMKKITPVYEKWIGKLMEIN